MATRQPFPTVVEIQLIETLPSPTIEPIALKLVEKAKVLFSYEAENEDELSLEEGMVITILEKELEDSGWWKGEINGKIGVFPDNFVSLLPPEERPRKPPPPSLPPSRENKHGRPISQASIDKHDKKEDKKGVGRKPVQPPPPVVGKKPHKAADPKLIAQTDDMKAQEMDTGSEQEGLGGAEPSEKLSHPTAGRAKVPQRRPPGPKTRESSHRESGSGYTNISEVLNEESGAPAVPVIPKRHIPQAPPTSSSRRAVPLPPDPSGSPKASHVVRANRLDEPTTSDYQIHFNSAPANLPQLRRPASLHPPTGGNTPARPSSASFSSQPVPSLDYTPELEELPTPPPVPPVYKEREDKPAPPVARTARPAPPTPVSPKEEEPPKSPVVTPRSPASDITPLAVGPSVDPAVVEDLKRELEELRASTVSREEYQALQKQIQHVKEDSDRMRQQFNKRIIDLMKEVDEEKKTRLNMQVEIDRLKKLVLPDNDSVDF